MMTDVTGASIPDQALVSDGAPADRHPSGFDPSRVVLTKSQQYAIIAEKTWSGAQRNKLIELGMVAEGCRGGPPLPKRFYETCSYALLLTPAGRSVKDHLLGRDSDRNPEGEDVQRLSAEHESAGRNGIAQPFVSGAAQ